jgi:hypothetical protein
MYIPSGVSEYGTTSSLFAEISGIFGTRANLSETATTLLTHFVFSTWLADCFSTAPRMLIYGPPEESAILLQLLAAICRRALLLGDVNIATWNSMLTELRPTMLINTRRLRARTREFLEASNTRHQYVLRKGQLFDLSEFTAAARTHARTLGASIVDAPELQAGLIAALRSQDEDVRKMPPKPYRRLFEVSQPGDEGRLVRVSG